MKTQLSEEILDILNESPRWLIRMGAAVIMFLLVLFMAGTWFIRYPEVLKGSALVTTSTPTIKVVSETGGRLMRLLVPSGTAVRKGDIVAEMENPTKLENTAIVQDLLRQTRLFLNDTRRTIALPDDSLRWGDLQADVLLLRQNYLDFKQTQADGFYARQVQNLQAQQRALRRMQQAQARKKDLNAEELANASAGFQADQKLVAEGVYSRAEFRKKENDYLAKKREQEDFTENLIKTELKRTEAEQELQRLEYAFREKQRLSLSNLSQAAQNIGNRLQHWQQQYLITAPSDGKLVYLQNLAESQFVQAGATLFSVLPAQQDFVALVDIPVKGMGKAGVGQKVVLKLDDYPFQEFGTLEGTVRSMAPSPDVKTYRVLVALPRGLQSSYHYHFLCKSELAGSAEIITEDMRLCERAFYGIRKLVL